MSSANFFSLLEDNSSSEPVEIAKKKAQQQQQPKPQPKEATKDAKEQPKPQQKGKDAQPQTQGAEKSTQRPQTSQENRGRGGRGQQQRPQTTTGGDRPARREQSGEGRGRGERRPRQEGEGDNRPRREFKPRTERPATTGSPVDTTTVGGDQYIEKRSKPAGGKSHQYDANAPRRGRQFDRSVSGTGRGRGLKKGGEGAHNWGKEGEYDVRRGERTFNKQGKSEGKVVVKGEDTPVEGVTTPINKDDETAAVTPVEGEAKTEEETKVDETTAEEKKEAEEVTYEDYLKQQQEKRKALLALKPDTVKTQAPATSAPAVEKKKKEKTTTPKVGEAVSIQEFLKDRADELNKQRENERERGNRGGRGGNRRSGAPRSKAPAPDVKDTKAFPSLSGK